jgi:phosphoserine phosphatase RsbU/P
VTTSLNDDLNQSPDRITPTDSPANGMVTESAPNLATSGDQDTVGDESASPNLSHLNSDQKPPRKRGSSWSWRNTKMRLQVALVAPFMAQMIGAVSLVGYLSFQNGQESTQHLATRLRREVAKRTEGVLKHYFDSPQHLANVNVEALRLKYIDLSKREAMEKHFVAQLKIYENMGEVFVGGPDGSMIYVGRNASGGFLSASTSENNKRDFYQLDAQGNRIRLLRSDEFDARTRPWYKVAIARKDKGWSSVYQSRTTGSLGIAAVQPAYDKEGKLTAVFSSYLLLNGISDFLESVFISPTGQVFVMDHKGLLLGTSTGEAPFKINPDGTLNQLEVTKSKNQLTRESGSFLMTRFPNLYDINREREIAFNTSDGKPLHMVVQPYTDGRGLDLLVVVVVPEADFMESIYANTRITMFLCAVAALVALTVGLLTAQRIGRHIQKITNASTSMSEGDLYQNVPPSRITELDTLSQAFNSMAGQLKEVFDTLEDKVRERTDSLASANEEILALNERLKEDNLRLGAELNVARHIQMMLLPKSDELVIEGLDLSGYMKPADEVGGDYYDVLLTKTRDGRKLVTIGVGDVTGHGLESGVLMLMTQTAVRTLTEMGTTNPVVFLDTVNRTIYKNVQRMRSDKSLTLAILTYYEGQVSISGQHEEILVVRQNGKVERIDTVDLGFPIGLDEDIADFIQHAYIYLEPGEGIVLYTDGVTEARDPKRQFYGIDRLCEVIESNWHLSAGGVQSAIINHLHEYIDTQKVFDDITLLVLKRA